MQAAARGLPSNTFWRRGIRVSSSCRLRRQQRRQTRGASRVPGPSIDLAAQNKSLTCSSHRPDGGRLSPIWNPGVRQACRPNLHPFSHTFTSS